VCGARRPRAVRVTSHALQLQHLEHVLLCAQLRLLCAQLRLPCAKLLLLCAQLLLLCAQLLLLCAQLRCERRLARCLGHV
jgi:hypothetical protein